MANTAFKSRKRQVGRSTVEEEYLEKAQQILSRTMKKVLLPVDVVVAESFEARAEHHE